MGGGASFGEGEGRQRNERVVIGSCEGGGRVQGWRLGPSPDPVSDPYSHVPHQILSVSNTPIAISGYPLSSWDTPSPIQLVLLPLHNCAGK